jgi:hypothetical protein
VNRNDGSSSGTARLADQTSGPARSRIQVKMIGVLAERILAELLGQAGMRHRDPTSRQDRVFKVDRWVWSTGGIPVPVQLTTSGDPTVLARKADQLEGTGVVLFRVPLWRLVQARSTLAVRDGLLAELRRLVDTAAAAPVAASEETLNRQAAAARRLRWVVHAARATRDRLADRPEVVDALAAAAAAGIGARALGRIVGAPPDKVRRAVAAAAGRSAVANGHDPVAGVERLTDRQRPLAVRVTDTAKAWRAGGSAAAGPTRATLVEAMLEAQAGGLGATTLSQLTGIRAVNIQAALVRARRRLGSGQPIGALAAATKTWKLEPPDDCPICGWRIRCGPLRWVEARLADGTVRTRLRECVECGGPIVARQQLKVIVEAKHEGESG